MEGFKSLPKMQCFKEGGAVKSKYAAGGMAYKKGGHAESEEMEKDIAQDKAIVKKAFKMHDTQSHEGEKTDLSKLKKGGRMKKEGGCVGRYKSGGGVSYGAKKTKEDKKEIAAIKRMKDGGKTKKYADGGMISYSEAMNTPEGRKKLSDAKLQSLAKMTPLIKDTPLSEISESDAAKGLRNYGRMYKQGLGMKPDTAYEYKKGGAAKKYAEGGALKPVDAEENPGLAKLPTNVRNKMGYAKKGGLAKKYADGGMVTEEEKARMPAGKLPQQIVDEEAMKENTETREMVAGPLRKLKQGIMEKFKSKSKTPVAPMKKGGKAC